MRRYFIINSTLHKQLFLCYKLVELNIQVEKYGVGKFIREDDKTTARRVTFFFKKLFTPSRN